MSHSGQLQSSHNHAIDVEDQAANSGKRQKLSSLVKKILLLILSLCAIYVFSFYFIFVFLAMDLLLVVALVCIRFLQLTKFGDGFNQVIQLKLLIYPWLCITNLSIFQLQLLPILLPPKNSLKTLLNHLIPEVLLYLHGGLPVWVFSFCALSSALPLIIHRACPPTIQLDHYDGGINIPETVSETIICILFNLIGVRKYLVGLGMIMKDAFDSTVTSPSWGLTDIILGRIGWAIVGYNIIRLSIYGVVFLLKKACRALDPGPRSNPHWYVLILDNLLARKHVVYFANGLRSSLTFIFTSIFLLHLSLSKRITNAESDKQSTKLCTLTFACFLICSLFWLIKTFLLLAWQANVVHIRLESQILEARKQLYFLGLLGRHKYDIFKLLYLDKAPSNVVMRPFRGFFEIPTPDIKYRKKSDEEDFWAKKQGNQLQGEGGVMKFLGRKKKVVRNELLMPKGYTLTMYDIKEVTQYLLEAKHALSNPNYTPHILQYLNTNNPTGDHHGVHVKHLKQLITGENDLNDIPNGPNDQPPAEENENNAQNSSKDQTGNNDDWKIFEEMVNGDNITPVEGMIPFDKIQTWMEMAQKNCQLLASAVSSSNELVDYMNRIINVLIIGATIVIWLLITRLATTKVLLVIASPMLAASFIFGDTCRKLFESIIFVFVLHPFDVGDVCDVNEDSKMQVRAIGVWKTTFLKIDETGDELEVMYPNSELTYKKIIIRKTKFL